MIVRTDVSAHLERGMRVGFINGMKGYQPLRSQFTREAPSDGAFEIYGDLGAVPWPEHNGGQTGDQGTDGRTGAPVVGGLHEGQAITVLGGNERSLTVYNRDWNIPIGIYHNAINDNRVGGLENWARSAGQRFQQHMDYLCFNALNSGEATDNFGACYDGQAFFSATHADPGGEYTTAQDNQYALALSLDNFETVYVAGGSFLDDRGQPSGIMHNLLIHSINLKRTAAQIVDNVQAYDTANREMNPYAGTVRGLTAPGGWLDSTAWFIVAADMVEKPVNLQMREQPSLVFWDDESQGAGIRYYKWMARYEVFYGDWRLAVQGNT